MQCTPKNKCSKCDVNRKCLTKRIKNYIFCVNQVRRFQILKKFGNNFSQNHSFNMLNTIGKAFRNIIFKIRKANVNRLFFFIDWWNNTLPFYLNTFQSSSEVIPQVLFLNNSFELSFEGLLKNL